jgi:hypothetical protein
MDVRAVVQLHFELQSHNLCTMLTLQNLRVNTLKMRATQNLAADTEESPSHAPNVRVHKIISNPCICKICDIGI